MDNQDIPGQVSAALKNQVSHKCYKCGKHLYYAPKNFTHVAVEFCNDCYYGIIKNSSGGQIVI